MTLQALINKRDTFEIVRDQIALLLADEIANQRILAAAESANPLDYTLRIYAERSAPWEAFPSQTADTTPVVNVWFDSLQFDEMASNVIERQKVTGSYNIDIYGFGRSVEVVAAGFASGDETAAREAQRGARLVRNILMSAENTYLKMRGVVGRRRFQGINSFQPQPDGQNVFHVVGVRLVFLVDFNEFSPQYEGQELEGIDVKFYRAETGEILAEASIDYT